MEYRICNALALTLNSIGSGVLTVTDLALLDLLQHLRPDIRMVLLVLFHKLWLQFDDLRDPAPGILDARVPALPLLRFNGGGVRWGQRGRGGVVLSVLGDRWLCLGSVGWGGGSVCWGGGGSPARDPEALLRQVRIHPTIRVDGYEGWTTE